ncbi:MAG: tetratricopeptide repeat protein [Zoogloea sp.]|nr:tetratricopeptide repeat protein [Zoogloea sp.]
MIALRSNLPGIAARHFADILASDPEHPGALAAVSNLRAGDPAAFESRLRQALAAQPEAADLHFALGNCLARQQRWAAAQRAYLAAHELAPDDADALFNLAISLEHQGRPARAALAYRQALEAAAAHPAAFDRQQAEDRLRILSAPPEPIR